MSPWAVPDEHSLWAKRSYLRSSLVFADMWPPSAEKKATGVDGRTPEVALLITSGTGYPRFIVLCM